MTIVDIPDELVKEVKKIYLSQHPYEVPTAKNVITMVMREYRDNHKEDDHD